MPQGKEPMLRLGCWTHRSLPKLVAHWHSINKRVEDLLCPSWLGVEIIWVQRIIIIKGGCQGSCQDWGLRTSWRLCSLQESVLLAASQPGRPWRRKQKPAPVFLPGKSLGQRSLVGYSPWGRKELDMTERRARNQDMIIPCLENARSGISAEDQTNDISIIWNVLRYSSLEEVSQALGVTENTKISGKKLGESKGWKPPKCRSTVQWVNKLWRVHTTEYLSAMGKKQMMYPIARVKLTDSASWSERGQTQNHCDSTWSRVQGEAKLTAADRSQKSRSPCGLKQWWRGFRESAMADHVCMHAQMCPTLCGPMDCSPPGSSVHGILQARVLEQVAISHSRGSLPPRDWAQISTSPPLTGRFFTTEPPGKHAMDWRCSISWSGLWLCGCLHRLKIHRCAF